MINTQSFDTVVFCNFCHTKPAVGWLEIKDEDGKAAKAACNDCANKEMESHNES